MEQVPGHPSLYRGRQPDVAAIRSWYSEKPHPNLLLVSLLDASVPLPPEVVHVLCNECRGVHLPLPTPNYGVPDGGVEVVQQACKAMQQTIRNGGCVGVHCHGGKGRTGTLIAAFLVYDAIHNTQMNSRLLSHWKDLVATVLQRRGEAADAASALTLAGSKDAAFLLSDSKHIHHQICSAVAPSSALLKALVSVVDGSVSAAKTITSAAHEQQRCFVGLFAAYSFFSSFLPFPLQPQSEAAWQTLHALCVPPEYVMGRKPGLEDDVWPYPGLPSEHAGVALGIITMLALSIDETKKQSHDDDDDGDDGDGDAEATASVDKMQSAVEASIGGQQEHHQMMDGAALDHVVRLVHTLTNQCNQNTD